MNIYIQMFSFLMPKKAKLQKKNYKQYLGLSSNDVLNENNKNDNNQIFILLTLFLIRD